MANANLKSVYLDYNATASVRPEVIWRMQELLAVPANPSSVHRFGREARKHLENARKTIADAISAWPNEIIFTATGTEANATALRGFSERRVLVSSIEHSSIFRHPRLVRGSKATGVMQPEIPAQGGDDMVEVDNNGIVNLSALD